MDNSNTLKSMLIREFHSKFKVTKVYKYAKRGIRKKKERWYARPRFRSTMGQIGSLAPSSLA